jgi:hypothetical protein
MRISLEKRGLSARFADIGIGDDLSAGREGDRRLGR